MKFVSLLKRGANLIKIGRAVRSLKKATDEDKRQWAKKYLVEVLGQSRIRSSKTPWILRSRLCLTTRSFLYWRKNIKRRWILFSKLCIKIAGRLHWGRCILEN